MGSNGHGSENPVPSDMQTVRKSLTIPVGEEPELVMMVVACKSGNSYLAWPCIGDDLNRPDVNGISRLVRDLMHILSLAIKPAKAPSMIIPATGALPPFHK